MGTMTLAAALPLATTTPPAKGSSAYTLIFLVVIVGLIYLLFMRPQRNRQRRVMQTQSQVMPGQRVRTTAGMYGTVISGDDRDIVIEIAPGVQVTMLRRAVMEVIPDDVPQDMAAEQDMPDHEDIAPDDAQAPEQAPQDATPADDWDLKDRNL